MSVMTTKTVKRAYKFRFYPTPEQEEEFFRTWGCVRVVYNRALEWRNREWMQNQKRISYAQTDKAMTEWKREKDFLFLAEVSCVPLQQCLRHLQTAFVNFFEKRAKYPKFKSRKKSKLSLTYSGRGFRFSRDGELMVAKLSEPLNVAFSRPFDYDSASTITVSKDSADRWFVSILCEEEIEQFETVNQSVGIDLGVKDAVVLSDGRKLNPSDSFDVQRKQAKITRLQKRLTKKTLGSNNRVKARTKLARAYAEYVDAKKDWLHKVTTALVEEFDIICIEDLNVRGMSSSARGTMEKPGKNVRAKSSLNRGIMQNNFAEFRSMLEYKTDWYGGNVIAIDRFFPSSKLHAECGAINDGLSLDMSLWKDSGSRY